MSDALRVHGDRHAEPGLLDFAVNIWPGARPGWLREVLVAALDEERYPDERPAVAAIAARHGRPPEEVLLLNGACEGFWLLAHALRPRVAACVHPSFTEPEAALRAVGAQILRVQRRPGTWTLVPADVPAEAEVVVTGNPNNPTGTLDPVEGVAALAHEARVTVVDESFMEFVPGEPGSMAACRDLPGLVVVRSLTKAWTLPGVRAGYLLASADLVERLTAARQPWSVNALACAALEHCANDQETPARVAGEVADCRADLLARLAATVGVQAWPSAANFVLIEIPGRGEAVVAGLRDHGMAVRPCHTFPGLTADHVRIAVRHPPEHARLAAVLRSLLEP
ncbi:MAG TPA: aminotransferase class I/II-fold pyridoxal phosphate-dependent enzyme [Solirubrobacteraceae bacterium]|nr:aminotransferase class I/II-fold pyridoxal phosphate-dependent enzyme [Solirubrobacteraceae bacterium]